MQNSAQNVLVDSKNGLLMAYSGEIKCEIKLWDYQKGFQISTINICSG
jgi:hypothetical protein